MSDITELAEKLALLASADTAFADGARQVSRKNYPDLRLAILHEIDNTILGRDLTFQVGQSNLTMSVAGRRLKALVGASDDLNVTTEVIGQQISFEDGELLATLSGIIGQFSAVQGDLSISSDVPVQTSGQGDTGVTISVLAEAWHVDMSPPPIDTLAYFLSLCAASTKASLLLVEDSEATHDGMADDIAALQDIVDSQLDSIDEHLKSFRHTNDTRSFVCLMDVTAEGDAIAVAQNTAEMLILSFNVDKTAEIVSIWNTYSS